MYNKYDFIANLDLIHKMGPCLENKCMERLYFVSRAKWLQVMKL